MKFSALAFAAISLAVVTPNAACMGQPISLGIDPPASHQAGLSILGASNVRIDPPAPPGSARPAMPIPQAVAASTVSPTDDEAPARTKPRARGMWAGSPGRFFAGAFVALAGHEGSHYIANAAVGSDPYLKSVHYGPIPFFTIEPNHLLNNHDHYITASAGFSGQQMINEWLLTTHPYLRTEDEPFLKGMAAFSFWLTVGYAATAFAESGPVQRDTKGMADSLGWNERWVGAMILVPTALDTYRYKHPDAKWARDASRVSKLAMILLAATVHD